MVLFNRHSLLYINHNSAKSEIYSDCMVYVCMKLYGIHVSLHFFLTICNEHCSSFMYGDLVFSVYLLHNISYCGLVMLFLLIPLIFSLSFTLLFLEGFRTNVVIISIKECILSVSIATAKYLKLSMLQKRGSFSSKFEG